MSGFRADLQSLVLSEAWPAVEASIRAVRAARPALSDGDVIQEAQTPEVLDAVETVANRHGVDESDLWDALLAPGRELEAALAGPPVSRAIAWSGVSPLRYEVTPGTPRSVLERACALLSADWPAKILDLPDGEPGIETSASPGGVDVALSQASAEAALVAAARAAAPRRCQQHGAYPGDGLCRGEPSDYCESLSDALERVLGHDLDAEQRRTLALAELGVGGAS